MKALTTILILILTSKASASCFDSLPVKEIIAASDSINNCFENDDDQCDLSNETPASQKSINSKRLIPIDRSKSEFLNNATGIVEAKFENYGGVDSGNTYASSTAKISRCHIVTSAHLLYTDGLVPIEKSSFQIMFKSGQTCDPSKPFQNQGIPANVYFNLAKINVDFKCSILRDGKCIERAFLGKSDLVILRLDPKKVDKNDRNYYTVNTSSPETLVNRKLYPKGQRVNCWGYPGYTPDLRLPKATADLLLWGQKDARIYGVSEHGIVTNSTVYKGMSGGGCTLADSPTELVGLNANDNRANGKALITTDTVKDSNFLSGFQNLDERLFAEKGIHISDLDKQCD